MKNLNLDAIRIDGKTQSRVEINNEAVGDYAEAVKSDSEFPPVVVFFDGADYWLADGFHRYHAHKQAGRVSIEADVRKGTVRDAILHSLGANRTHGLRMTNADKRKAVATLLGDAEWAKWTDRAIASFCGVTHPFVAGIRNPKVVTVTTQEPKKAAETIPASGQQVVTVTTRPQLNGVDTPSKPTPKPEVTEAPPPQDDGPSAAEIAASEREAAEEIEALRKVALADDKVAAALDEAKKLRALNRVLQERNDGLMNEKAELVKRIKALQRKLDKLEQPA